MKLTKVIYVTTVTFFPYTIISIDNLKIKKKDTFTSQGTTIRHLTSQKKKMGSRKQWTKILKCWKKMIAKLEFYVKKFPQKFRSEKDVIDK